MKTNIRKAKISDLDAIKEIEDESFINPFTKEDLLYEISQNPVSNFLVLEKDGLVVGFIDYWVTFDSATIDQIAVKKSERNQGFAKILLEKSINDLKELGLDSQEKANLMVSHINSQPKEKLKGRTPLEIMKFMNPELFKRFIEHGIEEIEKDKVILKPYLLKNKK